MARNSYFQFKQFRVEQADCAMKVTIDACLLGAMAEVEQAEKILDIGTGTGLLSLMAAQRSKASVTAVELDQSAYKQASENFANSPWSERLTAVHSSIQSFTEMTSKQFDLIICNPPFFHNCYKAPQQQRVQARHTDSLNFEELAKSIETLLEKSGQAWVLLPVEFSHLFIDATQRSEVVHSVITLSSSEKHRPHRHIVVLGKPSSQADTDQVTIYQEYPSYSDAAYRLLKPYYLYL